MTPQENHNYRKARRRQLYAAKRLVSQGWKEVTSEESSKVMDDLRRQRIWYNFCTQRELQRLYGADNITHGYRLVPERSSPEEPTRSKTVPRSSSMSRLMAANTRGELHDHVHYKRDSCKSAPACKPLSPEVVAAEFSKVINERLKPNELALVRLRNKLTTRKGTCATHDYIDANTAMEEAFKRLGVTDVGVDVDIRDKDTVSLWNAAWDIAREKGFQLESAAKF